MTWIESHQELARHPKTKRLARNLECSVPAALGHLHLLWWWATDYAPDGDLSAFTAEDIADALLWEGDPQTLIEGLQEARFLDDGLQIHDWDDYAGRLIDKREANRERMRRARANQGVSISNARAVNMHSTNGARVRLPDLTGPNNTGPNRTGQNKPDPDAAAAAGSSSPAGDSEISDDVFAHYRAHVNQNARMSARKEITARLERWTPTELKTAIDHFARHSWWMQQHGHEPASWFFKSDERIEQFLNLPPENRPPPRPISHAEALADPDRFDDPWLQDRSEKFKAMGRQHAANQRE